MKRAIPETPYSRNFLKDIFPKNFVFKRISCISKRFSMRNISPSAVVNLFVSIAVGMCVVHRCEPARQLPSCV